VAREINIMRARNIKPGFFENEEIAELEYVERLLFIGLWCYADREGLFEIRPKRIKAVVFPYDNCDVEPMIVALEKAGLISIYTVGGEKYGMVLNFKKHQRPHPHEAKSKLPSPTSLHGQPMSLHRDAMCSECTSDIINTVPDSIQGKKPIATSVPSYAIAEVMPGDHGNDSQIITEHGEIVPF